MTETIGYGTTFLERPEPFPMLPALAKRLGVEPVPQGSRVMLVMKDGTGYDLFALANAFLDRMDKAGQSSPG